MSEAVEIPGGGHPAEIAKALELLETLKAKEAKRREQVRLNVRRYRDKLKAKREHG